MKKIIVLGVRCLQQQATITAGLPGCEVQFANSLPWAIGGCKGAAVVALHTEHEGSVDSFYEAGFKGKVIPLFLDRKKQGMRIRGKLVDAVPVRNLAETVQRFLNLKQPESSVA